MQAAPRTWRKPPFIVDQRLRWALWVAAAIYFAFAFGTLEINWNRVSEGLPRGQRFLAAFFPPDFVEIRGFPNLNRFFADHGNPSVGGRRDARPDRPQRPESAD